jgi:hypothetical protein
MNGKDRGGSGGALFGGILIIVGVLFLLGQLFDINLGRFVWPFFVIVPGVLLLAAAFVLGNEASVPMVIVGSMVTMTGALLLYQNTSGHWESWAYGWALVAPTSIGLGQIVYGWRKNRQEMVQTGKNLATIGGVIFLGGAIFFELIIGISGFGLGRFGWPVLLIGLGILWLIRGLLPGRRKA